MENTQKPKPLIAASADRVFWDGVRAHKLMISRCRACGRYSHPRSECLCGSSKLDWVEAAGTGNLYTYIVYHRPFHPAFIPEIPYNVAWIELDEKVLILSNVIGCENADIRIGMRVRVVFEDDGHGNVLPKFEPVPDR